MNEQSHQLAPSPDYSLAGDLHRVTIECRECGDTEEQFVPLVEVVARIVRRECDECHAEHVAEAKTAFRLAFTRALESFKGEDEVEIICQECCEAAAVYDPRATSVSGLDGKAHVCEACGAHGKLVLEEPDSGAEPYMKFRAYTARELESM
jgi:hypothetical protein